MAIQFVLFLKEPKMFLYYQDALNLPHQKARTLTGTDGLMCKAAPVRKTSTS